MERKHLRMQNENEKFWFAFVVQPRNVQHVM